MCSGREFHSLRAHMENAQNHKTRLYEDELSRSLVCGSEGALRYKIDQQFFQITRNITINYLESTKQYLNSMRSQLVSANGIVRQFN